MRAHLIRKNYNKIRLLTLPGIFRARHSGSPDRDSGSKARFDEIPSAHIHNISFYPFPPLYSLKKDNILPEH